jgi:hypothetical protein
MQGVGWLVEPEWDRRTRAEGMLRDLEEFLRAAQRLIDGGHVERDELVLTRAVRETSVPGAVSPYTVMIRASAIALLNQALESVGGTADADDAGMALVFSHALAAVRVLQASC